MSDRTGALRREIERSLPERPFAIELWDGSRVQPTSDGDVPTLRFRSPRAISQLLRSPGQLGFGRAYVLGDVETGDLDGVVAMMGRWSAPRIGPIAGLRLLAAALRATGLTLPPRPPAAELHHRRRRHTRNQDAEAVRHHYDVSNEFFALFLDESMTYSCALFEEGVDSLEAAQSAKLGLICRKLELRPGTRMLDVGCGWGSLAIHAAREHGASVLGITLSEPQAKLATERAREARVDDRVEIRVLDYRELAGEPFDAIASIGMVEHVGLARVDEYARCLAGLLGPGGRLLNHGITRVPPTPHGSYPGGPFFQRYVFPDAELLNLWRMLEALERAGLETLHVENLHTDYAETLRHWAARFDSHLDEAERIAGPERTRVWRLYLRAARNSFEIGENAVYQVLCSRPITEAATPAPLDLNRSRALRAWRVPARRRTPL
jgi:cyclopropane-fatty-acyl-phospholipid synthase